MNITNNGVLPAYCCGRKFNATKNNKTVVNSGVFNNCMYDSKLPDTISFLGTYYATTDTHSRLPMCASTLSEIENHAMCSDEPVFLLDCGDFTGVSYSFKSISDMFIAFKKRNPDITCIFNLGNYDIDPLLNDGLLLCHKDEIKKLLKDMTDNGINIVSASYYEIVKRQKEGGDDIDKLDFIKPYMLVDDVVDGKKQTVFISGIGMNNKNRIESEKAALNYIKELYDKDNIKADKVVLMIHDGKAVTNKLLDYAKETLGIENIELVIGGHPHSIEDYKHGKTRVLYPPSQGKGAFEIHSTKKGFEFEPLNLTKSGYDYSQLAGNPDVIDNSDINKPLDVKDAYKKILFDSQNSEYLKIVTEASPYNLEFRDYDSEVSMPSSFGTFMTNHYRKYTGCDIALSRNQFLREKLPSKGKPVNKYNICDSINADADLYKASIDTAKLKEIFEISFEKQDKGLANSCLLEYSDNLRITRRKEPKDNEDRVCQIEIKENGRWKKLLDKDGKPLDSSKTFSLVSEDALMCGKLVEFFELNLNSKKLEGLTMRGILERALQEETPEPDEPCYHTSQIINV